MQGNLNEFPSLSRTLASPLLSVLWWVELPTNACTTHRHTPMRKAETTSHVNLKYPHFLYSAHHKGFLMVVGSVVAGPMLFLCTCHSSSLLWSGSRCSFLNLEPNEQGGATLITCIWFNYKEFVGANSTHDTEGTRNEQQEKHETFFVVWLNWVDTRLR